MQKNNHQNQSQSRAAAFQNSASGQEIAKFLPQLKGYMNETRSEVNALKEKTGWLLKTTDPLIKMMKERILSGVNDVDALIPNGGYDEKEISLLMSELKSFMGIVKFPFNEDDSFGDFRRVLFNDVMRSHDKLQKHLQDFFQERHERLIELSNAATGALNMSIEAIAHMKSAVKTSEKASQSLGIEEFLHTQTKKENMALKSKVQRLELKVFHLQEKLQHKNNSDQQIQDVPIASNGQRFTFKNVKSKETQTDDISCQEGYSI